MGAGDGDFQRGLSMGRKRRVPALVDATRREAVIYCRVSTREQVNNLSLDTQEQRCREWCGKQGYVVRRVFREEGESAKTAERPVLRELLEYCERNLPSVQYLVVYALDRFSRNTGDYFQLRERMLDVGVRLRSATQPMDESSSGVLLEGMGALYGHYDNAKRRENTLIGMQARIDSQGMALHGSPGLSKGARRHFWAHP